MTSTSPAFNLRTLPWVSVRYLDGHRAQLGLDHLFHDAHLIRALSITSAAQRAGVLRFLISAATLVVRKHGPGDLDLWDDLAGHGFDPAAVTAALDEVGDVLWLQHPNTPFMQDAQISGEANITPISSLAPMAPGGSSKTWWGRQGDGFTPDAFDPAQAAAVLTAAWFYSPAGSGRPPARSYSDGPAGGWKGRGTLRPGNQGVRSFWVGGTLAETLLGNIMHEWVTTDTTLPLWATRERVIPTGGGVLAATWTGTTYQLVFDGDQITGYRSAGRRPPGMAVPDKAVLDAMEENAFRADPTIMLEAVPAERGKVPTGATRTVKPLAPGTSGMEYLTSWWLKDVETGRGAVPARVGLVELERAEILIVRIEGATTAPQLTEISWLNIDERLRDRQREIVLTELAGDLSHHTRNLRSAVRDAFDDAIVDAIAPRFAFSRINQAFAQHAEHTLASIVRDRGRGPLTSEETRTLANAVVRAFDDATAAYITPRTVERVAVARQKLQRRAWTSPAANRQKENTR